MIPDPMSLHLTQKPIPPSSLIKMQALLWNNEHTWYNNGQYLRELIHSFSLAGYGVEGSLKTEVEANLPVLCQCHEGIQKSVL